VNTADDVLNVARLVEAYGEDRAGIATLLGLARDTELRYITELRAGMTRDDIVAVAGAAHSIKGSASNIGATRVSRVAADIEDRARVGRWDGIADLARQLDLDYAELVGRIAAYAASVD
jgi:HPt (histidine-containing phosphotransfer) domain-containing protein